ncbi:MAG: 16S rRNA (cytosine(1402)-N(4))-methyltransferase RsmH [Vicinamibacteria bacterium]|nr:16S rRNA (cytosine(1402)-N(4))-methyltransferase RsmH [Vicinamibacteria bacterium]
MAHGESVSAGHVSVLRREILAFAPQPTKRILDATLGLGGHAHALLSRHPEASLIAFDRDEEALAIASGALAPFAERTELRHRDFRDGLQDIPPRSLCYAIADLGVSSLQLDSQERGFSFRFEAPLDMRMDTRSGRSASDILNTASEKELERILREFGEEPKAKAIARSIVMERRSRSRWTTSAFASLVRRDARGRPGLDPATRAFQALRIATNSELSGLEVGLERLAHLLRPGGRLAVIAFHSLEDRIVKNVFRSLKKTGGFELLTPKPIVPQDDEKGFNARSRSAKLRVVSKRGDEGEGRPA